MSEHPLPVGNYGRNSIWQELRWRLVKLLVGNATCLINVDHNHEMLFVNVSGSICIENTDFVTILPASDRAQRLANEIAKEPER